MKPEVKLMIFTVAGFVGGWAVGSLVTKKKLEKEYEDRLEEETASIKFVFDRDRKKLKEMEQTLENYDLDAKREAVHKYSDIIKSCAYSETNRAEPISDEPKLISYGDFLDASYSDYQRGELTYYRNGVLAYDDDEVLTRQDADITIGKQNYENIGTLFKVYDSDDPDTCYILNEKTLIVYEIFRSDKDFIVDEESERD